MFLNAISQINTVGQVETKYGIADVIPVTDLINKYGKNKTQEYLFRYWNMHLIPKQPLESLGLCLGDNVRGIYDIWGKCLLLTYSVDNEEGEIV